MKKDAFVYLITVFFLFVIIHNASSLSQIPDTVKISDDLILLKISDNTYIHISYLQTERYGRFPCNGLVYVASGEAYIIDTPVDDEATLELINWIKENIKVPVEGVIVNHWHVDCMGGLNQAHNSGIKSYACELTCEIAASKNLPVPQIGFKDSLIIISGKKEIVCKYFGGAHTFDNIFVWIPEDHILFAGCTVKSISSQSLGNTRDADMDNYMSTLEKVLNEFSKAEIVVPGHGNHGGTELLLHTMELVKEY